MDVLPLCALLARRPAPGRQGAAGPEKSGRYSISKPG